MVGDRQRTDATKDTGNDPDTSFYATSRASSYKVWPSSTTRGTPLALVDCAIYSARLIPLIASHYNNSPDCINLSCKYNLDGSVQ